MSELKHILAIILLLNGFALLFLQIFAHYNLNQMEERRAQSSSISYNWFLQKGIYNASGQWACGAAKRIWLVSIPLLCLWLYLRY